MHNATVDHLSLAPPQQGRWLGPVGLALFAHGLLVAALTWGVSWKNDATPAVFDAELWSSLPQQAAARAAEPPPPPPPPPAPMPAKPAPAVPKPAPPPPPPSAQQADIATAQARKKAETERKLREEAAKKAAAEKVTADKLAAEKKAAAEKAADDKERQQKQLAQKREQERLKATEKREEALAAQRRDEQMRRIMGQAGASGSPESKGSAQQSSGPSPGYAGRVSARIRPNVVFTEVATGNPRAEVEVRTLPDGTITSVKLAKSSGNKAWDDAALRAIERTATLPRDTDGKVPPALIIFLRPQD